MSLQNKAKNKKIKSNMELASNKRKPYSKTLRQSSRPTEHPWNGYDWDSMPTITPEQGQTFRSVVQEEHEGFKRARGRPKKDELEKTQPITLTVEPSLLQWVQSAALNFGLPKQTYFKILLKKP